MVERIVVGPMHTNAYIYSEWKKECVILDPGGDPDLIVSHMSLINLKPRGIILTHGHIDHVSAAASLKEHYHESGIDLQIAIHKKDRHFMGSKAPKAHMDSFGSSDGSGHEGLDAQIDNLPKPDILVEEGDQLFDADLVVLHTPGHTPGSVCIYSESQGLVFSGDTLLFEEIGRTDLPGGDHKSIVKSIKEKVFVLPDFTRVCPGHGPFTTLEREIRHNPFLN